MISGTPRRAAVIYRPGMRRSLARHLTTAIVLLCLQLMATAMTLRRDPLDRFQGAAVSGLVWWTLETRRRLLQADR